MEEEFIADLHIHSRFARATSKNIDIPNLVKWAKVKGIQLLGTGDFQHPQWSQEIKNLEERDGILYYQDFPFLWQTEISLMYKQGDKGRRIHHIILAPNGEVAKQITDFLASKGRLDYDGRPIFGFSSIELAETMEKIDKKIEIIPAHIMTPWFGVFGSKGGFDNLKEAFGDKAGNIHAVESGMSADPEMLRKFSFLNKKSVVSFSDSHSFWPWRMGREATVFNGKITYENLIKQIRENSFKGTIETEPSYGRYHWDGHRNCDFSCSPEETRKLKGICPKCGQPLTIGVEYRVEELTDQNQEEFNQKPYYKMLPLHELIVLSNGSSLNTKKTWATYNHILEKFRSEFEVLLNVKKEDLSRVMDEKLVRIILENRESKIKVKPGYDGEYGVALLNEKQKTLF